MRTAKIGPDLRLRLILHFMTVNTTKFLCARVITAGFACVAAGPRIVYTIHSPSANYCTDPALSSKVDARIYVSVSDRRVARAPHDWPNSYVCVTVGRSDMSK